MARDYSNVLFVDLAWICAIAFNILTELYTLLT